MMIELPPPGINCMTNLADEGWNAFTADQMRSYARQAVAAERERLITEIVDAMQAAVVNGELPAACEEAYDWLERNRAAIRKEPQ